MTDSNELSKELKKVEEELKPEKCLVESENSNKSNEKPVEELPPGKDNFKEKSEKEVTKQELSEVPVLPDSEVEKKPESGDSMGSLLTSKSPNKTKEDENVEQVFEKPKEVTEEKMEIQSSAPKPQIKQDANAEVPPVPQQESVSSSDKKSEVETATVKKVISLVENYTDSSQSSSSEIQSAPPFESSSSSQEQNFHASRIDFENAIQSSVIWTGKKDSSVEVINSPSAKSSDPPAESTIPVITIDESTESSAPPTEVPPVTNDSMPSFVGPGFQSGTSEQPIVINDQEETDETKKEPRPVTPIIIPTPRKRGRPRKQILPNPSPIDESWGPNGQEFTSLLKSEGKRSARAERRQAKKKKFEDREENSENGEETPKRRYIPKPPVRKKKSEGKGAYTPKKKAPPSRKKHSEIENFQNFEEETRMSASENSSVFSSRTGAMGDESQGSSATTEGQPRSNISKKGRMEVMTDGCKPITVQQIVEYFWPPQSSLGPGEKPDGLMIQEQITEYLGVKSFKRRYPSIKRRPVDMEERNYLQENGFVSENMCDLGLTAVFSADILEIMYNDFPQKFEEYRKYTREKKAKEQRALREKQAAERADMDPKKEAIEAAHSWNSEFNKARR